MELASCDDTHSDHPDLCFIVKSLFSKLKQNENKFKSIKIYVNHAIIKIAHDK